MSTEKQKRKARSDYIVFNDYVGRMDPVEKEVWIQALLTEFAGKQGRMFLKTPEGKFCCLGVYCEIKGIPKFDAVKPLVDGDDMVEGLVTVYGANEMRASFTYIPHDYNIELTYPDDEAPRGFEKFMFNGGSGLFGAWTQAPDGLPDKWVEHTLPSLNDDGLTFPQIADVIRYIL